MRLTAVAATLAASLLLASSAFAADKVKVGFVSNVAEADGKKFFRLDTSLPGNGNGGHEGKAYGTELSPTEKTALVEFLKTF